MRVRCKHSLNSQRPNSESSAGSTCSNWMECLLKTTQEETSHKPMKYFLQSEDGLPESPGDYECGEGERMQEGKSGTKRD